MCTGEDIILAKTMQEGKVQDWGKTMVSEGNTMVSEGNTIIKDGKE